MDPLKQFIQEYKEIIVAVVAGTFAIIAALIRKEKPADKAHQTKPVLRLLLTSCAALVAGAALLGAEFFVYPIDPEQPLGLDNPGSVLLLAGCLLVAAGAIWGLVNLVRLKFAKTRDRALASVPVVWPATPGNP